MPRMPVQRCRHAPAFQQRLMPLAPGQHQPAFFKVDRAAAARQVAQQHRVFGIHGKVQHLDTTAQAVRHRHAVRVFRVEHHRAPGAAHDHSLDLGQFGHAVHAVHAQMVGADVEHDGHIAAVEAQAALQQAAARGLQHRGLHLGRGQHHARGPVAGAVAFIDALAVDVHAFGAGHAGTESGQPQRVRDHAGGGGLAIGAGDRNNGDAAVAVRLEHGVDDGGTGAPRQRRLGDSGQLYGPCRMHAENGALLFPQRPGKVAADQVDRGDVQAQALGRANTDVAGLRRQMVCQVDVGRWPGSRQRDPPACDQHPKALSRNCFFNRHVAAVMTKAGKPCPDRVLAVGREQVAAAAGQRAHGHRQAEPACDAQRILCINGERAVRNRQSGLLQQLARQLPVLSQPHADMAGVSACGSLQPLLAAAPSELVNVGVFRQPHQWDAAPQRRSRHCLRAAVHPAMRGQSAQGPDARREFQGLATQQRLHQGQRLAQRKFRHGFEPVAAGDAVVTRQCCVLAHLAEASRAASE